MKKLVERCLRKEEGAWEELVEKFADTVYSLLVGYYRLSLPDADDLFQNIFIEIYKDLSSLKDPNKLKSWVKIITRNKALNFLKRTRWEQSHFKADERLDWADSNSLKEIEKLDFDKKQKFVMSALASLKDVKCRNIIESRYFDELSHDEISKSLQIPKGSIGPTLMRNYRKLRTYFKKLGIEEI